MPVPLSPSAPTRSLPGPRQSRAHLPNHRGVHPEHQRVPCPPAPAQELVGRDDPEDEAGAGRRQVKRRAPGRVATEGA